MGGGGESLVGRDDNRGGRGGGEEGELFGILWFTSCNISPMP